jgi:hypothetical protein
MRTAGGAGNSGSQQQFNVQPTKWNENRYRRFSSENDIQEGNIMRSKLGYSALVLASLFGSTLAASAQAGGAEGVGAATIPGREVRVGEQGRPNMQPGVTTGSAGARSNAMQSESQYTIGEKEGRGSREKPDASEVAPAGH